MRIRMTTLKKMKIMMKMKILVMLMMMMMDHPLKKSKCCLLLFGRSHLIKEFFGDTCFDFSELSQF